MCDCQKPDPTIYLKSLKEMQIQPNQSAYVGDAASDIQLAHASGKYL